MYSMGERVHHLWPNVIYIFEGKGTPFESMCTLWRRNGTLWENKGSKGTVFESLCIRVLC